MHRFFSEFAGKPQCGEVEVSVDEAVEAEFGLSVFAGAVLNHLFAYFAEAGELSQIMFFLGFIAVAIVGGMKLYHLYSGAPYILVTDSPYFYLSLL